MREISDLILALQTAGYYGMFLREDRSETFIGFGSRDYVANLAEDLRVLYLDNESSHVIQGLSGFQSGSIPINLAGNHYTVKLPKIGEGENGIVYDYQEAHQAVLKLAKPRPYSRNHLKEEYEVTDFFEKQGVPVPAHPVERSLRQLHDQRAPGRRVPGQNLLFPGWAGQFGLSIGPGERAGLHRPADRTFRQKPGSENLGQSQQYFYCTKRK